MNFYNEVKEIIHSEYDWDDISSGKIAKAITDIHNKQLANSKYLNADEVEKIVKNGHDVYYTPDGGVEYFDDSSVITAICNLAIPDIDRDKINQELLDQLYRFEGIMGKYDCQLGGMECNFQIAFHRLIRAEIDEIIKAIRGEE